MATYTGFADSNGDFSISFGANSYTSGEKITVTAEKDSATKSIELYAPSDVVEAGGVIQFLGSLANFPENIGGVHIDIPGNIGKSAFLAALSSSSIWQRATSLVLGNSVTGIGNNAFENWTEARYLDIPDSVNLLGISSFSGWYNALELTIPNSITAIPNTCFAGWTKAKSLVIPASVTSIGGNSFQGWTSCDVITVLATIPPTITSVSFQTLKPTCIFKVPADSVAAYQAATNWSGFASRIQAI
ncbi:leucine-rich repeat domain-containing protein [Acinetobacter sp. ANC 7454]|uniref:leucine-rich repeat domain-containing protein n=1 Tax=Acinetobacter thermotolerans TaxID=3151487 RepID=UPI00325BD321